MRYQTEIVERLSEGLASVSLETAAEFREAFTLSLIHISEPTRP